MRSSVFLDLRMHSKKYQITREKLPSLTTNNRIRPRPNPRQRHQKLVRHLACVQISFKFIKLESSKRTRSVRIDVVKQEFQSIEHRDLGGNKFDFRLSSNKYESFANIGKTTILKIQVSSCGNRFKIY